MSPPQLTRTISVALLAVCVSLSAAARAADAQSDFERGYYLQTHENDLEGAIAAYDKVAADESANEDLREEARQRAAACREDVRSSDFARLMPPDAIAYAEFVDPGQHVENIVSMLGLLARDHSGDADTTPSVTPLGDGLYFPDDFHVSPALIDELKNIKGAAVALTSIDNGQPDGVAVIHPGDSGLIRGVLETAVQLLKPEEPIEGFRTYSVRVERENLLVAVTARLFLIAKSRDELVAAVERLNDPEAESLASQERFRNIQDDRTKALLFAYVDGRLAQKALGEMRGNEVQVAARFLDLEHLNSVSVVLRTTNEAIELQAKMDLAEGHRNLLYSLLRTAPMTRRSLDHVPSGAAAVVIIGLNPPGEPAPAQQTPEQQQYLALMDIGRELFGNIEEVGVFLLPTSGGGPIPDVGVILAVKDAQRSEVLWNQLLALPAIFNPGEAQPPRNIEIEGQAGKEYQFPEIPPIALVRAQDRAIVAGTRPAVEAALKTGASGESIIGDSGFRPLLDSLTPESSKAVLVHVGRTLQAVSPIIDRNDAAEIQRIAPLLDETRVILITDEKPTQFTIRAAVTGLPDVPTIVKALQPASSRHVSQSDEEEDE